MRVLMVSMDRKMFELDSAVRERIIEYGGLFDELHVVIFATKNKKFKDEHIAPNIWLYPTNSWLSIFYPLTAYRVLRSLIRRRHFDKTHTVITAQDPFETGIVALAAARRFQLPLQIQVHTDFFNPNFIHLSFLNQARLHIAAFVLPK